MVAKACYLGCSGLQVMQKLFQLVEVRKDCIIFEIDQ